MRKARRAAARRNRQLRIMFTDEARFGRMNWIRPCWAPIGMRPAVAAQLIREYIYLYGAVSPKDGTCVYLIMPTSNTACFQVFLDVLARKFAREDILLVLDGAPNHRSVTLSSPPTSRSCIFHPIRPNSIQRKISGMKSARKSSRTMRSNPWTLLRQTQAGCPIHRAQSKARPLHHRLPLYSQLALI